MTVFNFSAGPAVLPKEVLQRAAAEMLDWHGSGMSVMEMSHRGSEFISIADKAEADLRKLMSIGDDYEVLFLQGGAIGENAIVPMNLLGDRKKIDFINTGEWSKKSIKEAKKYAQVNIAASCEDKNFTYVPNARELEAVTRRRVRARVHQRDDRRHRIPMDARRRRGAAGGGHVIAHPVAPGRRVEVRRDLRRRAEEHGPGGPDAGDRAKDLLDRALPITPSAFHWKEQAESDSMLNTPPTYAIYIAGMVFEWLLAQGGLAAIEQKNIAKAKLLYDALDASQLYYNPVRKEDRSRMNVPFKLRDESLDGAFLKGAQQRGLLQLKGHRSVGGMRASIYNAMPIEGVQALVDYMREFERRR